MISIPEVLNLWVSMPMPTSFSYLAYLFASTFIGTPRPRIEEERCSQGKY
jgi:hypothetical protein